MNFMSYVAEVSRGWDEPNARDMGRMTSQPNAKGEMYILNDDIDMKVKIAAMSRRLEELEMKKMQEVQAISQTALQAMPCAICLSYEHLVDECPTIPAVREMFGDCNTYNSNWRDHPNFSWEPQPPQYKQPAQAPQQASNLDQAMVNLSKVVGDFVGAQKSINAHLSQRIDSVESSLNKKMDEVQNDLSQKIDNLQDSISRFANLNTMQEKENSPSQPYQNSMSIHEMEAKEGEPSQKREVKEVITLRSGKEVDLPTSKREHKRIVIKEELMKKHMPPLFLQAFPYMASAKSRLGCENGPPLRNKFCSPIHPSTKIFAAAKPLLGTRVPFRSTVTPFRSCEMAAKSPKHEISNFRSHSPISQGVSQLRNTPLAHECHFAAQYPHFAAAKWAAKMAPSYENPI
ncbi:hypothetical protein CK203_058473 [Vitis vinifera]|uniref:Retrotransposon gag protein n=1 Tax=Vitis vinifera TaxID=29760 RepID=A0A438H140_VITVI|nr:hypothetical protein CK203_058473 [Vitis vinifera]